ERPSCRAALLDGRATVQCRPHGRCADPERRIEDRAAQFEAHRQAARADRGPRGTHRPDVSHVRAGPARTEVDQENGRGPGIGYGHLGQGVHRPPDRGHRRCERGRRRPREASETDRWTLPSRRYEERGGAPRPRGDRGQPRSDGQLCHRHRGDRDRPRRLPGHVNSIGLWRIRTKTLTPTDEVVHTMGSTGGSAPLRAEEVVRRFYDFLARGRLVDALNLFTTDARLRDASGRESAGIRAITSSLLTYRVPQDIAVEEMEPEDGESRATIRSPGGRSVGRFSV